MKNNYLVDTNFLLAFSLVNHPHHSIAYKFLAESNESCLFHICRSVQISYLRLLTQKIDSNFKPLTNDEAIQEFNNLIKIPNFKLIDESFDDQKNWTEFAKGKRSSPYLWMDAYISYFAYKNNLCILTFDKGFLKWKPQGLMVQLLK